MNEPLLNPDMRSRLLANLEETVADLINVFSGSVITERDVYDEWNPSGILRHLTFWHESFARNVFDLVQGRKPTPLKGKLSELNQRSVGSMSALSVEQLLSRLEAAQNIIRENILSERLLSIPYRKGSRDYSPEEHLEIVTGHIQGHLKAIEKGSR